MRKTCEEYQATAMLLGMAYDESQHTFYSIDCYGYQTDIDADTLEVISNEEFQRRWNKANPYGSPFEP